MNIYVNTNEQTTRYEPIYKSVCQGACFCSGACKAKHNIIGYKVIEPGLFGQYNTKIISVQEYEQIKQEEDKQIFSNMIQNIDKSLTEIIETPNVGVSLDCKLSIPIDKNIDTFIDIDSSNCIFITMNELNNTYDLYVHTTQFELNKLSNLDVYLKVTIDKGVYDLFIKNMLKFYDMFTFQNKIEVLICDDDLNIISSKFIDEEALNDNFVISFKKYREFTKDYDSDNWKKGTIVTVLDEPFEEHYRERFQNNIKLKFGRRYTITDKYTYDLDDVLPTEAVELKEFPDELFPSTLFYTFK